MGKDYVAGVSFSGSAAQIAVLELRSGRTSVAHLEEWTGGGSASWYLGPLLERRQKLYRKVERVSVAFDESQLIALTFPVDAALDHVERNRHIHWELSNFIADFSPKDFIVDSHILRTKAQEQLSELLVIAAQRSLVFGVQQTLADARFELGTADTRMFGGLYALLVNYPERKDLQSALVLLSGDRIDIGTVAHGRLTAYAQLQSGDDAQKAAFARSALQGTGEGTYLFGDIAPSLMTSMLAELGPGAELLDPLRRLPVLSGFRDIDALAGQEYRFAPSIGVALRKQ
jgi:hypothetical protein